MTIVTHINHTKKNEKFETSLLSQDWNSRSFFLLFSSNSGIHPGFSPLFMSSPRFHLCFLESSAHWNYFEMRWREAARLIQLKTQFHAWIVGRPHGGFSKRSSSRRGFKNKCILSRYNSRKSSN